MDGESLGDYKRRLYAELADRHRLAQLLRWSYVMSVTPGSPLAFAAREPV